MLLLTQDAVFLCGHALGKVSNAPSQGWVTVQGRSVLVRADPEGRPIAGCVNAWPLKPCLTTLAVRTGYSSLLRVDGREICLDTVRGHIRAIYRKLQVNSAKAAVSRAVRERLV